MIIVTGGAGFIGSNLVKALNDRGHDNIIVVDNLTRGAKFQNLVDCRIADYFDKDDFIERIRAGTLNSEISIVFHQGACSRTTEWDGRYMMRNNYEYSKLLLLWCLERKIPFIYASSASVYGAGQIFREDLAFEKPLNIYGYSKLVFDQYVRRILLASNGCNSQVVGFRYFNVYGPREQHKHSMASVPFHLNKQILEAGRVRLFAGSDGYNDGEQRRDFVHVNDVIAANLWFMGHPELSGIFNLGTGRAQTFNEVAQAVIAWHGQGEIEYIPFPEALRGCYQSFTQADMSSARAVGFDLPMKNIDEGIKAYLDHINEIH